MFHAKEGWFFGREKDGRVRIIKTRGAVEPRQVGEEFVNAEVTVLLEPDMWASVVASVSAKNETTDTYHAARDFHAGV